MTGTIKVTAKLVKDDDVDNNDVDNSPYPMSATITWALTLKQEIAGQMEN
jgi:hypothetical protein